MIMTIKAASLAFVAAGVAGVVGVAGVAAHAAVAALRAQQPGDAVLVLGEHLREPFGVTFAADGTAFIVEHSGNRISMLSRQGTPKHISIDWDDSVLIADTENHVIRRYTPHDGLIDRVAGTGVAGASGLGGSATAYMLNHPHGAQMRPGTRAIYISDSDNQRVLRVER